MSRLYVTFDVQERTKKFFNVIQIWKELSPEETAYC